MTRLLPLALFLGAMTVPADAATQPYSITHFDSIRLDAPIQVIITTNKGVSARGEGDRDTLDGLEVGVNGSMLTVRLKAPTLSSGRPPNPGSVTLRVSTDQVTRIIALGAGTVELDRMKGLSGIISLRGPGTINVANVALDRLVLGLVGEGKVSLAGKALIANIDAKGAGTLSAEGLMADTLKLSASGAGVLTLAGGKSADIQSIGAATVTVSGKPACKVARLGTGRVVCGGKEY